MQNLTIIVSLFGVLGVGMGGIGVFRPQKLIDLTERWHGPSLFRLAIAGRLVLGAVFIVVAPYCRYPVLIQTFGILAIVAAFVILVVGHQRLDAFIGWWGSLVLRSSGYPASSPSFSVSCWSTQEQDRPEASLSGTMKQYPVLKHQKQQAALN